MKIDVTISEMSAAASAIAQANQEWRDTITALMKANQALVDVWQGETRDRFVEGMEKRHTWYTNMADLVDELVATLNENANTYTEMDQDLVNIIRKK